MAKREMPFHPLAQIASIGHPLDNFRSKWWDELTGADAPHMDFVIAVCNQAAAEVCRFPTNLEEWS